jgi:protein transport protein SEC31
VSLLVVLQEEEIQKAIFVGNYDGAVDTCLKAGRLADALLIANIGGAELFKKTMQRYMRRNPRPYMAVSGLVGNRWARLWRQPEHGTQVWVGGGG